MLHCNNTFIFQINIYLYLWFITQINTETICICTLHQKWQCFYIINNFCVKVSLWGQMVSDADTMSVKLRLLSKLHFFPKPYFKKWLIHKYFKCVSRWLKSCHSVSIACHANVNTCDPCSKMVSTHCLKCLS